MMFPRFLLLFFKAELLEYHFIKPPFAQLHRPGDTAADAAESEVKGAEHEGISGVDPKMKQVLK